MDKRKIQMAVLQSIQEDMDKRIVDRMRPKGGLPGDEMLPDDEAMVPTPRMMHEPESAPMMDDDEDPEMIPGTISDDLYMDEDPSAGVGGEDGLESLKAMLNEPIPEGADEATSPAELDAKYAAGRKFGRR